MKTYGKTIKSGSWQGVKVIAIKLTEKGMNTPINKIAQKFKCTPDDLIRTRSRFGKSIKNKNNTIFCYK